MMVDSLHEEAKNLESIIIIKIWQTQYRELLGTAGAKTELIKYMRRESCLQTRWLHEIEE